MSSKAHEKSKGIPDFIEKFKFIRELTGDKHLTDAFKTILSIAKGRPIGDEHELYNRIKQGYKSWERSNPNGKGSTTGAEFLCALGVYLVTCEYTSEDLVDSIINSFCYGSISDLHSKIDPSVKAVLGIKDKKSNILDKDQVAVYVDQTAIFNTFETAIVDRKVDQKLCYLSPDSPVSWHDVTTSLDYNQYRACENALGNVLSSAEWQSFCVSKRPDGAISLGAGSASKDLKIIESLIENSACSDLEPINFALIDSSTYMLTSTIKAINDGLSSIRKNKKRTITLYPLLKDFLVLKDWDKLRRVDRNIAWFINGGTIGNIDEREFFKSVSRQSIKGDWISISIDTIPEKENIKDLNEIKIDLTEKYDKPYLKKLMRPALIGIWPELDIKETFQHAIDNISFNLVSGQKMGHSNIANSLSVEFSIQNRRKNKIVLLASTRYKLSSFIEYAENFEFEHIVTSSSSISPTYKIVSFKYIG